MDDLMDSPLLSDLTLERVTKYTIDFLRIVGVPLLFNRKVDTVTIQEYRGKLPCNRVNIEQITYEDSPLLFSHNVFHEDIKNNISELPSVHSYYIKNDYIYTSIKNGDIKVAYNEIMCDDDGCMLIEDNSNITRALALYIKVQKYTLLLELGKISRETLYNAKQDYAWAVGSCETDLLRMDATETESAFNLLNSFVPKNREFEKRFLNSNMK
jgi:hypothetical protein